MDSKIKHLEMIQAVIARMSNCSFAFKGWTITIASALFGVAVVGEHALLVLIALCSTLLFWGLDGYYLWIERAYVELYNRVVDRAEHEIDFSMRFDRSSSFKRWIRTCLRPHLVMFYGTIVLIEIVGVFAVGKGS